MIVMERDRPRFETSVKTGKRILVVDDNFFNVDVLKGLIQDEYPDFCVKDAFGGQDALEIIKEDFEKGLYFDFFFIDVNMPEMNGCLLADEINKLFESNDLELSKGKCIAVTAQEAIESHPDWKEGQFQGTLFKPLAIEDIIPYF